MAESKAFKELKYRAWTNFLYNGGLKTTKSVLFKWEKKLPAGRSKFEHYNKGCNILKHLIEENTKAPETTVLIVGSSFVPILFFADDFSRGDSLEIEGAYETGKLNGVSVVVEPSFTSEEKLLIDLATGDVISVDQGLYDYDADMKELLQSQGEEYGEENNN